MNNITTAPSSRDRLANLAPKELGTKIPQVEEQLEHLSKISTTLQEFVEKLWTRLTVVIPPLPLEETKACNDSVAVLCPLAERLRGVNDMLRTQNQKISDLIQVIEL